MLSRLRNRTGPAGTVDRREVRSPAMGLELSCDFSVHFCWQDFWFSPIVPQKSKFISWLWKQARARWRPDSIKSASQHSPGRTFDWITLMFSAKSLTLNAGFWLKNPVFQPPIRHFHRAPHPSGQSDKAALVIWWSWDEPWVGRFVTVLWLDFRF